MKKSILFLNLLLLNLTILSANAQVLLDDFNRANSTTVGSGWTEYEPGGLGSGATIANNNLRLASRTSSGASGKTYVYKDVSAIYNTVLSTNAGTITWEFNMKTTNTTTGFNSGSIGAAYVLGSTSSNFLSGGTGYAVVMGHNGNKLRLVSFNNSLGSSTGIQGIISSTNAFTTENLSVKVTYTVASDKWNLSYKNDGASFASPLVGTYTSVGNAVNNTYVNSNLSYTGFYYNYGTSLNTAAIFDNLYLPNPTVLPTCPTLISPLNGTTNLCASSVLLKWNATMGAGAASNYKVYIGTNGGGVTTPTNLVNGFSNGVSTQYSPTGLADNTTYYWQVIPTNSAGTATGCSIYSFTTSNTPTVSALNTTATKISSCGPANNATLSVSSYSSGTLRWQSYDGSSWINMSSSLNNNLSIVVAPTTTTMYRASVSGSGCTNANSNVITITVPTVPSYIVSATSPYLEPFSLTPTCITTSIVAGVSNWNYAPSFVNATNGTVVNSYKGSYMATFNGSAGESARLMTPDLDLTSTSMTKPWFSFSWVGGKNGTLDKLNVYLSTDNGATWGSPVIIKTPDFSWYSGQWQHASFDLSAYTAGKVRVMFEAVSAGGSPIAIDEISVFNMTCATPSALANTATTYYSNTFNWAAMGDSAQVRYRKLGTTTWIYSPFVTTNSWSWNKLVPNTTFEWAVDIWCNSGAVTASSSVTTLANSPLVTGMAVTNISAGKATLSWNTVPGAVKYSVSASPDNGVTWEQETIISNTSRTVLLSSGTTYSWRVITLYGFLYVQAVDTTYGPTFGTSACAASNLKDTLLTATSVKLSWTAISGATKYWIRLSTNGGSTWSTPFSVTNPYYTRFNLSSGTTYSWQIAGSCDGAIRNYVSGPNFTTPAARYANVIEEETLTEEETLISVYPNPFEGHIQVALDSVSDQTSIKIFDMMGKEVLTSQLTDLFNTIPTASLSKGMYIVYIFKQDKMIYTTKIIKQ